MTHMDSVDRYMAAYNVALRGAAGPAWMSALREAAIARVAELGLPTTQNEEWKYTNVSAIAKIHANIPVRKAGTITLGRLTENTYVGDGARLVFVNGLYAPELSSVDLPGVTVSTISAAARGAQAALVESHIAKIAPFESDAFTALNTAFLRDGALVVIPAGMTVEKPIQLMFLAHATDGGSFASPRVLILAERGSRATVVESHVALAPAAYFSNSVAEILCEEGASLEHYRVQEESVNAFHIASINVRQEQDSHYRSCLVTTGGRLARTTLKITLNGERCECELDGLSITDGQQHVDNHTQIDHTAPNCSSRQLYKSILKGNSRAVFNGKVIVRQAAQKTDAKQTNKNLILSDTARVDTKPQLEIFADDVKCTHGATIGQIDDASLFYLKTRGIGEEQGRQLLTYGFAHEVLEQITLEPLRERLDRKLLSQISI